VIAWFESKLVRERRTAEHFAEWQLFGCREMLENISALDFSWIGVPLEHFGAPLISAVEQQ
jgi:hypothetical protein